MCGLRSKISDSLFIELINKYDLIVLLETFASEEDEVFFESKLHSFKVKFEFASKKANFGRNVGGSIFLINSNSLYSKNLSFESLDKYTCIKYVSTTKGKDLLFFPIYLNFNAWETEFHQIKNVLLNSNVQNLVFFGDLNGRIGDEQSFYDYSIQSINKNITDARASKDFTVNTKGRKVLQLMEDLGLVVLNGRTEGDEKGEFTFIGAMGCSVIDLAAVSVDCLSLVSSFKVLAFPGSDHLPIEIYFAVGTPVGGVLGEVSDAVEVLPLLPKLKWCDKDKEAYQTRIGKAASELQLSADNQENVNNIVSCIVECTTSKLVQNRKHVHFKQPWFDFECFSARKRMFRLLNVFRRTNSAVIKSDYMDATRYFKSVCTRKKKENFDNIINSLKHTTDARSCWAAINSLKVKDSKVVGKIQPGQWIKHFKLLLNPPLLAGSISFTEPFLQNDYLDSEFTLPEIKSILAKLKNDKAPGYDRVSYEFYKYSSDSFIRKLLIIYDTIYANSLIPSSFKRSIVFPLHKKGDVNSVNNYRGLSFIDCVCKIFTTLLNLRLSRWADSEGVLSEFQAGFRKGYSTIDNIFNLTSIVHLHLALPKGKLFCFFVDFSAAFDTIDRNALIYKLSCLGVSTRMLAVLRNLYKGTTASVWCREGVTEEFDTKVGLRQGCVLSPLLFSLFVNDLPEALEGGCNVGGRRVNVLLYADDIVLMAPTAACLQHMIKRLENYCETWNLKVNLNKSKIMVFRKGGRLSSNDRWWFKGEPIGIVNEYKYLGVTLTSSLSWETHFKEKVQSTKFAISSVWGRLLNNSHVPLSTKYSCYNAVVRAIGCYGAQVWGYIPSDRIEAIQRYFFKRIFRLPNNTPNYVLFIEANLDKLFFSNLKLHVNYILSLFDLDDRRLPGFLARLVLEKNVYWYREWKKLGRNWGVTIDLSVSEPRQWRERMTLLVETARVGWRAECEGKARTSQYHSHYLTLDLDLGRRTYLTDNIHISLISWIMKARAGVIDLNYKPWVEGANYVCSLCNLHEDEDVFHFVAKCPILKFIRKRWFGAFYLRRETFENYLNGGNWVALGNFLKNAWIYRWDLILEYNV